MNQKSNLDSTVYKFLATIYYDYKEEKNCVQFIEVEATYQQARSIAEIEFYNLMEKECKNLHIIISKPIDTIKLGQLNNWCVEMSIHKKQKDIPKVSSIPCITHKLHVKATSASAAIEFAENQMEILGFFESDWEINYNVL